jgi:hypothetical protein
MDKLKVINGWFNNEKEENKFTWTKKRRRDQLSRDFFVIISKQNAERTTNG